jgi:hypothetical protein
MLDEILVTPRQNGWHFRYVEKLDELVAVRAFENTSTEF